MMPGLVANTLLDMKSTRILRTLAVLTAATLGIAGCSNDSASSQAGDTVAAPTATAATTSSTPPAEPETKDPAATDGSFCEVMLSDVGTAATAFSVVVPGMSSADDVNQKLALIEHITTPPEGLEQELLIWKTYLETAATTVDNTGDLIAAYDEPTKAAGNALFRLYVDDCMSRL